MIQNDVEIDPNLRSEIIKFFNTNAGKHLVELLESMTPKPEEVPAVSGDYAPQHIYHIRAGVTQGYLDCLYNLRAIPELKSTAELENETELEQDTEE